MFCVMKFIFWSETINTIHEKVMLVRNELAPDEIRAKYRGKLLSDFYRYRSNKRNPARYSF